MSSAFGIVGIISCLNLFFWSGGRKILCADLSEIFTPVFGNGPVLFHGLILRELCRMHHTIVKKKTHNTNAIRQVSTCRPGLSQYEHNHAKLIHMLCVYLYICVCVCLYVHTRGCFSVCIHTYIHAYIATHMYTRICATELTRRCRRRG